MIGKARIFLRPFGGPVCLRACLPEGLVLAGATAALLGSAAEGDPAPAILGGVDGNPACPDVTLEQLGEVAGATLTALAAALPRRGLATIPPLVARLHDHASGRLLTAQAEDSPFALFAWPAESPERITTGLRLLLSAWPTGSALISTAERFTSAAACRYRVR